ncbi:hypothetical protein N7486_000559 [Penicillium sp. IBT 16267x]|nr:hypothetical protein N7486_000559 [Penicillium sp. IBT 16267x]
MKATFALSALLATVAVALPTRTSMVPGATTSAASMVSKTVHSVLTVTNQQTGKNMLVELEQGFASQLTGLNLGSASSPVGTIVQTASSLSELQSLTSGLTGLTFVTSTGEYVLVELDSVVEGLLATLGLSAVGDVVGTVVYTLEEIVSSAKRSELNNVLSITGLNNEPMLVKAESTLASALGGLDLSSVQGTVGTVVASVPVVSDLAPKASELGLPTNELFGVLSADGSSALLVRVESVAGGLTSTVTGLLSTLGLGDLTSTVGTVVTSAQGATAL